MTQTKYFDTDLELSALSKPASSKFPAKLAYRAFGDLSKPAIFIPTCFGGTLDEELVFLYRDDVPNKTTFPPVLSTQDYFIIACGLMGGSESSSPSNAPAELNGIKFPLLTYEDNVRAQHALCQHLGVEKLFAYIGFSMGGQQAYHMATLFPDFVANVVCIATSARTSGHNWSFLEGPKAALVNSVDFKDGHYTEPARRGTGAFGRVYSTWALSQEWYRQKCWEKVGRTTLEEYLTEDWEKGMSQADAHNLLCMARTWQAGNITVYHPEDKGDLAKTLRRIKARVLVMPSRTDAYFPPEDNVEEVKHLSRGKLVVIESIWGHLAGGGGGTQNDHDFIAREVKEFLSAADS